MDAVANDLTRTGAVAHGASYRRSVLGSYTRPRVSRRTSRVWLAVLGLFAALYGASFTLFGSFLLLQFTVPLLVLAALVIWLLPDTGRAPDRLLDRLVFAFLIALLCWPDYLALALPGLPWITAIRLVGVPLAATLLIALSASAAFRGQMKHVLSAIPAIWKLMVLFVVVAVLTLGLSRHIADSISKFIVAQLAWTSIFFASAYVFSKPGRVFALGKAMIGIALFVSAIGIYEVRYSRVPWAGRVPSFLKVEDESVQRILAGAARAATGIYRVQSKFTTSLGLAEFLGFAMPFVLHIMMTTRNVFVRIAMMAMVPYLFWILVKTDSRLGMIGFFMSCLLYLFAWGVMRWRQDKRSLFGPAVVISYPLVFTAFITATFFVGRLRAMVWGTGAQQASTETRKAMYEAGIPMVMRNPIGHGAGEGAITLGFYNGAGVLTIDTYYLAVALEYGVIGFLAYYAMFLIAIWRSGQTVYRTREPEILYLVPLGIALANFVISKSVFSQQENHPLIFAMLGAVVALVSRQRDLDKATAARAEATAPLPA